jgi:sigma-B regulation protein RsbU (phosphoserine phosphatase)
MNRRNETFGTQRLVQVIQENQQLAAAEIILKVIQATQVFSDDYGFLDDFTLVILRREKIYKRTA